MPRKRGPGRPKFPKGEALDEVVRMRVRVAEKVEMEAAAKSSGMSLSDWAREKLLDAARGN
jgi:hypothetical protein